MRVNVLAEINSFRSAIEYCLLLCKWSYELLHVMAEGFSVFAVNIVCFIVCTVNSICASMKATQMKWNCVHQWATTMTALMMTVTMAVTVVVAPLQNIIESKTKFIKKIISDSMDTNNGRKFCISNLGCI